MCNNTGGTNMKERHADQGHRKFWSLMKEMTWKERLTHIWYYYARYILLAAFSIYLIGNVIYDSFKPKQVEILSGCLINVSVSTTTERILTDDAFPFVGGEDPEKQKVALTRSDVEEWNLHAVSNMQTKVLAGDYDYVLMDQTALDLLIAMQALPTLDLLLPEEDVEEWKDHSIFVQTEGVNYPVAIDITGTPLAEGCSYDGERIFLGFPVNEQTLSTVKLFYDYLTGQGLLTKP